MAAARAGAVCVLLFAGVLSVVLTQEEAACGIGECSCRLVLYSYRLASAQLS